MKREETEELVSIGKAAKILGVNRETLRRWEKRGKLIPDMRIGTRRHRRYKVKVTKKLITE
jgi:DNA-binding transcriptional MerR regulator